MCGFAFLLGDVLQFPAKYNFSQLVLENIFWLFKSKRTYDCVNDWESLILSSNKYHEIKLGAFYYIMFLRKKWSTIYMWSAFYTCKLFEE